MSNIHSSNKDIKPGSNDNKAAKNKKGYEMSLSAKGKRQFKDFQDKRNGSKFVIVRPR